MPHTYASVFVHCVFSTKHREPFLSKAIRDRLWPFMGGIARRNGIVAIRVGGWFDHAHLLLSLPAALSAAKAMQLIKSGSSKFIHETYRNTKAFEWQEGYGAFSVGVTGVDETIAYIESQEEHHRVKTFREEYLAFLETYGVKYDERYVFD